MTGWMFKNATGYRLNAVISEYGTWCAVFNPFRVLWQRSLRVPDEVRHLASLTEIGESSRIERVHELVSKLPTYAITVRGAEISNFAAQYAMSSDIEGYRSLVLHNEANWMNVTHEATGDVLGTYVQIAKAPKGKGAAIKNRNPKVHLRLDSRLIFDVLTELGEDSVRLGKVDTSDGKLCAVFANSSDSRRAYIMPMNDDNQPNIVIP